MKHNDRDNAVYTHTQMSEAHLCFFVRFPACMPNVPPICIKWQAMVLILCRMYVFNCVHMVQLYFTIKLFNLQGICSDKYKVQFIQRTSTHTHTHITYTPIYINQPTVPAILTLSITTATTQFIYVARIRRMKTPIKSMFSFPVH